MKTLAVLLGASILLNIALIVRRPAGPPTEASRAVPSPRRVPAEAPPPRPPSEAVELSALRARVRELEAARPAPPETAEAPDRASAFRDLLARALRNMKDPRTRLGADPESRLDLSEINVTFERARLERWKNPRTYTALLGTLLEEVAAQSQAPLADYQKAELRRVLEDYEDALAGMAGKDALEQYLQEVGPEADVLQRLRAFVTPEQQQKMMMLGAMSAWNAPAAPWVGRDQAEAQLVQAWTGAYGLEEPQKSQAAAAARAYVSAAEALNAQMGRDALPGRETAEWRRRSARILVDALGTLETALTPEQRERLRGRRPAEVRVFDPTTVQRFGR